MGKLDPWISEFGELIDLSVNLFNGSLESGSRIAIVLLDNCVEFMFKAYLRIAKRVVGTAKKYPIKPNEWESTISRRFGELAIAMKAHSSLSHDLIDDSIHYHRIRNDLYHTDTPTKTSDRVFKEHLHLVLKILHVLFNRKHKPSKIKVSTSRLEDTEFEHGTSTLDEDYERSIKNAQEGTKHHWRKEKGVWKIKKNWDNPERIMLSLLRAYPSCKSLGEIGTDTDLSSGYISNIIAGRRGDHSEFFKKCDEGYKLSEEGIYYFIDLEKVRDYFVSLDG